ncbi:MAG TPA: hypothetical protein VGQ38_04485 [Gaiellaceae bacterium]|nr:hypothetical protein [Gaiellaceae bacterium]
MLLAIDNRHSAAAPMLPVGGYRSYFENQHGEQLLFHQARGEPHASLWHGDIDFKKLAVERGQVDEIVLDLGEKLWLIACWQESAFIRFDGVYEDPELDQTAGEIAQAVVDTTRAFGGNPRFGKALASVMAQVSADQAEE